MYITEVLTRTAKGKPSHRCILLRESYRQNGRVKNRTLLNLTHCKPEEIAALRLALQHKSDLAGLRQKMQSPDLELHQGASVGAVMTVYLVAKQLGIEAALGTTRQGKLALWQVLARVIEQGSRLSAVRLAQRHAAGDVLGMRQGFNEDDLYENLAWLTQEQMTIEQRLFRQTYAQAHPGLYLYDVTSSYLEGQHNELGAFGYNRDGKRGKKQIVIGLLCDPEGQPLSIEVFVGNTSDPKTFGSQIRKVVERFGGGAVTLVGDRGMIKLPQMAALQKEGFHYITAITKPQIEKLLDQKILQLELFDEKLVEVEGAERGVRYVVRRNPRRAEEVRAQRQDKLATLRRLCNERSTYLNQHPRAQAAVALRKVKAQAAKLKIAGWVVIHHAGRALSLVIDQETLAEEQKLDGCYALKTDLPAEAAGKELVHARYKDLTLVERAFRDSKTVHLEMRPVYVVKEASTRGHALVVMLAYRILRHLQQAWQHFNLTVKEGLAELTTLSTTKMCFGQQTVCHRIPKPNALNAQLLHALQIQLPDVLPCLEARVVTKKTLQSERKKR